MYIYTHKGIRPWAHPQFFFTAFRWQEGARKLDPKISVHLGGHTIRASFSYMSSDLAKHNNLGVGGIRTFKSSSYGLQGRRTHGGCSPAQSHCTGNSYSCPSCGWGDMVTDDAYGRAIPCIFFATSSLDFNFALSACPP